MLWFVGLQTPGKLTLTVQDWQNGCPSAPDAQENPNVNAVSTGLYALVGASLCRLTGNMTYCDRAYASLQWIDRILRDDQGLIYDHIIGTSCELVSWLYACQPARLPPSVNTQLTSGGPGGISR